MLYAPKLLDKFKNTCSFFQKVEQDHQRFDGKYARNHVDHQQHATFVDDWPASAIWRDQDQLLMLGLALNQCSSGGHISFTMCWSI